MCVKVITPITRGHTMIQQLNKKSDEHVNQVIDDDKYTIKQASKKSGMSESWWRQQCYQKNILYLKVGRKVIIPGITMREVMRNAVIVPSK